MSVTCPTQVVMMTGGEVQCPISLETNPLCPQITPCGHVFAFHSIMQHLMTQVTDWLSQIQCMCVLHRNNQLDEAVESLPYVMCTCVMCLQVSWLSWCCTARPLCTHVLACRIMARHVNCTPKSMHSVLSLSLPLSFSAMHKLCLSLNMTTLVGW